MCCYQRCGSQVAGAVLVLCWCWLVVITPAYLLTQAQIFLVSVFTYAVLAVCIPSRSPCCSCSFFSRGTGIAGSE